METLLSECPVPWTAAQEKALKRDYPLAVEPGGERPLQEQTVKVYLDHLWLPESIMPLRFLAPSLLRLAPAPGSGTPHALHVVLEPLLLTVRGAAHKYAQLVPDILAVEDAPAEPEVEESAIWYAWAHERAPEPAAGADAADADDEEGWRRRWLDRMEKRETLIQILLYFTKLSLPGAPLPSSPSKPASPRKRSRHADASPPRAAPALEERLESHMDKLAMWQLVSSLGQAAFPTAETRVDPKDERDWLQRFCEDVVEACFAQALPRPCALLRSKLFPHSPFSDASDTDTEPTRARSTTPASATAATDGSRPRKLARAGSAALSVSLAKERALRRSASIGAGSGAGGRRALSREVSMSRVFRERERTPREAAASASASASAGKGKGKGPAAPAPVAAPAPKPRKEGVTLVEATPVKGTKHRPVPSGKDGQDGPAPLPALLDGVLVGDTPTKRTAARR